MLSRSTLTPTPSTRFARHLSRLYLILVPIATVLLAFGLEPVNYRWYVPPWLIHVCLMGLAARQLGGQGFRKQDVASKRLVWSAVLLLAPWLFISLFAGMGPPPDSVEGWLATVTEQQVRYAMLTGAGVCVAGGITLLQDALRQLGEPLWARLGGMLIQLALPLFLLNMAFWRSFLPEAFGQFVASGVATRPGWYAPLRSLFAWISAVEVGLTYLATAAFAVALRSCGWFRPFPTRLYLIFSTVGVLLAVLPPSVPEPWATASFAVSIPAMPFLMPYSMGLQLLWRAGNTRVDA
ncbi:hypothetical protein SAMN05421823_11663 [Catalinimonas alkaloidigena]|uniref:Uncharacterized protein n=1 Tax=Catalinimonas alkaloidigena TaxID=1075417 RepID=A0A1G9UH70_9BACT|nr:hypothetical protein [Catalinimonas alkaloidigena]SDM59272.1 hypothetical protein SAMN05421823_11663 [Catalinimonas alkaloidigena]